MEATQKENMVAHETDVQDVLHGTITSSVGSNHVTQATTKNQVTGQESTSKSGEHVNEGNDTAQVQVIVQQPTPTVTHPVHEVKPVAQEVVNGHESTSSIHEPITDGKEISQEIITSRDSTPKSDEGIKINGATDEDENKFKAVKEEKATAPDSASIKEDSSTHNASKEKSKEQEPKEIEGYRPMRCVMVQTAMGYKPPSGGYRGNYATLYALVKHGHKCMQFCWGHAKEIREQIDELPKPNDVTFGTIKMVNKDCDQASVTWWKFTNPHGIVCICLDADVMRWIYHNPTQQADAAKWIENGARPARAKPYADWIEKHIREFAPTHVIFNDTFAGVLTSDMLKVKDDFARVEVIHTLEQLPHGPYAGGVSGGSKTSLELPLWKSLDAVVAVSKCVQTYAKKYNGLDAVMIPNHAWSYKDRNTGDWPRRRSNFAQQTVVMINPAYIKGYEIFLGMARLNQQRKVENSWDPLLNRPIYNFVAYSSWGSKPNMVEELTAAGVKMHESNPDNEPIFDGMSVLIVPSLWQEAWGLVATEAQIRGIPVIASDVGGLPEAKRYVPPFVVPNKIDGSKRDAKGEYVIPPQPVKPWMDALDKLLNDKEVYDATSDMAFYTTREWLRNFDTRAFEKLLLKVMK